VRWVMTHATAVALQVKPPGGKAQTEARANRTAGLNSIVWNGKLRGHRAPRGRYLLSIAATHNGKTVRSGIRIRMP
jgi:hypothetical protein